MVNVWTLSLSKRPAPFDRFDRLSVLRERSHLFLSDLVRVVSG